MLSRPRARGPVVGLLGACLLSAALLACATTEPAPEPDPGPTLDVAAIIAARKAALGRVHAFDCDGERVVADFGRPGEAWVFFPDGTLQMAQQPTASGARFEKDGNVFWTQGQEAIVERADGRTLACRRDGILSILEDAKLRGVDFMALGNEPPWLLEIGPDAIFLQHGYGGDYSVFPIFDPLTDVATRTTTYEGEAFGHQLHLLLVGRDSPCQDTMVDRRYGTHVVVSYDGRTWRGCGEALH
jgi:uncharacterized membrane protein/membrane-bound inhibitor of C-type lysozyme